MTLQGLLHEFEGFWNVVTGVRQSVNLNSYVFSLISMLVEGSKNFGVSELTMQVDWFPNQCLTAYALGFRLID